MYDFHKTRDGPNSQCFQHSLFIKGRKELLKKIKRKNSMAEKKLQYEQSKSLADFSIKHLVMPRMRGSVTFDPYADYGKSRKREFKRMRKQ